MHIDLNRRRLLQGVGIAAAAPLATFAVRAQAPRVIDVVARKFEFVPGELHVKKGETVVLHFTAPEVPMGFNLADFKLRADLIPGKVTAVELTPDRTGTFTFVCDIFCGSGHEDMSGTLIVS